MNKNTDLAFLLEIVLVLLVAAIALELAVILIRTVGDIGWCYENYSIDRLTHCLYYESSVWGRFFQP